MELKDLLTECKQLDRSKIYDNNPSKEYLKTFSEKKLIAILTDTNPVNRNQNYGFELGAYSYLKKKHALNNFIPIDKLCKILIKDDASITKTAMLKYLSPQIVNTIRPAQSVNNNIESVSLTNDFEAALFDARYKDNSLSANDFKVLLSIGSYRTFKCHSDKISDVIYRKAKKNKTTLIELIISIEFTKNSLFEANISYISDGHQIQNALGLVSIDLQDRLCLYTEHVEKVTQNLHSLIGLYLETKNSKHEQELYELIQSHPDLTQEKTSNLRKLSKLFTKD